MKKTEDKTTGKITYWPPLWDNAVILIYPFKVAELDLKFDLQIPTIMDNTDEFIDQIHDVGSYYGPCGTFTYDEIKQLNEIYENLCKEFEITDSNDKSKQRKLQKQIHHFEKYCICVEEDEIYRSFFTDANFPMFKRLEKVDDKLYKVLSYST